VLLLLEITARISQEVLILKTEPALAIINVQVTHQAAIAPTEAAVVTCQVVEAQECLAEAEAELEWAEAAEDKKL